METSSWTHSDGCFAKAHCAAGSTWMPWAIPCGQDLLLSRSQQVKQRTSPLGIAQVVEEQEVEVVKDFSPVPARTRRPVCWSGRGMSPFHRSRALGGPLRRPMAAPPSRVWELEQRLQKVCPLERPGYLGTAASALRRRPGSGIPHHRPHRIIDSTVVRAHPCAAGAPPKKAARRPRPWAGAAAGSAPRST